MSELDFPQHHAQRVSFFMGTKPDKVASEKEGRPIFVECPFIRIHSAGDTTTIIEKPVWDDPRNPNSHTRRFPEEWKNFKAGVEASLQGGGTPLKLMPGISQAQVRELEHFHVHTVEQLADIADAHASKFMGIQALKNEARTYLLRAKGGAADKTMARELEKRDLEIENLKAQMQQLIDATKATAASSAPLVITDANAPAPKKRQRAQKA